MSLPTIIAALTKTNSTVVEDKENRITEYEANIELSGVGGSERGSESSKPSKSFLNFVSNPLSQNNSVRESERGSESNKPPPKSFLNFISNPLFQNKSEDERGSERGSVPSKPGSKSFFNFISNPLFSSKKNSNVKERETEFEGGSVSSSFLNFITNPVLRNDKDLDDNDDAPRFTLSTGTGSLNVSDSVVNQTSKTVQFAEHHDAYQISFGNDSVLNQNYGSDSQAQRDSVHKVNVRKE